MRPKTKRHWWDFRWLSFHLFKRAALAILVAGVAAVGVTMFGTRSHRLHEQEIRHDFASRQLRLKAKIAELLADADQPTDYVMAYHYTCNVLTQYDVAILAEAEANDRVRQTVRSCAYFRPEWEPPQTPKQQDMAHRSARLTLQAARHAEAAAAYRRAIWQPWTVTQDIAMVKDEP